MGSVLELRIYIWEPCWAVLKRAAPATAARLKAKVQENNCNSNKREKTLIAEMSIYKKHTSI